MFDLNQALNDCLYSDLYKSVTGCRPRNVFFASQEELDEDLAYLHGRLETQLIDDQINEARHGVHFEFALKQTRDMLANATEQDAFRVLLQAEGIDESFEFYGTDFVEHHFGLKYGYLRDRFSNAKTLQEALA